MKGYLFFGVSLLIAFVVWNVYATKKEGFQAGAGTAELGDQPPAGAFPGIQIPLLSPRQQTLQKGAVADFAPPTTNLLAAPPGQLASVNTFPAIDPEQQPVAATRIQSIYESLAGFFRREAPGLETLSDPSVSLPLTTARADRSRLGDELEVLKRNPGIRSTVTEEDMAGIEANLGYLQKKWRLSVNSGTLSPMPPSKDEGFEDAGVAGKGGWKWMSWFFGAGEREAFQSTGPGPAPAPGPSTLSQSCRVMKKPTVQELQEFSTKVGIEVLRLQGTGTTDPNIISRVDQLNQIDAYVSNIIKAIGAGTKTCRDIPFNTDDMAAFLPTMRNPNTPLPDLFTKLGLPDILNSLFPYYFAGDVSGAQVSRQLLDKYQKTFFSNLSWEVNLDYKGEAEREIARNYADAMLNGKLMAESEAEAAKANATVEPVNEATKSAYRGMFETIIKELTGQEITADVKVRSAVEGGADESKKEEEGAASDGGAFNWKERVGHICQQIQKRGMNPGDFACMSDTEVDKYPGFSWRGHAKVVCNRLMTVYDPSVPELCGCPPQSWAGWRA